MTLFAEEDEAQGYNEAKEVPGKAEVEWRRRDRCTDGLNRHEDRVQDSEDA